MPTISERQSLIQEILHDVDEISHISRMALADEDADEIQSSDSSSSSSSSSDSSSGSDGFMSVDTDRDTDEERAVVMGGTAELFQIIIATRILNPHLVAKCPQLDLVLIDFKLHDPKRF